MGIIAPQQRPRPATATSLFLKRWLRGPLDIGAIAPSGAALSRAMSDAVLAAVGSSDEQVIELGAGTGSFTAALRERGLDPQRLISIERDPELFAWLREHFPGLRLLAGDAANLPQLLAEIGVQRARVVFSGLPILSMPRPTVRAIVGGAFSVLAPGGAFVQFTYGPTSPVAAPIVEELGLHGTHGPRIWRNVPPAVVWTYRRKGE